MKLEAEIVIIGGGPTGLGAAHRLAAEGYNDWLLLERNKTVGGLSRSFRDEAGYTWDIGGHVVFSHYDSFSRMLETVIPPENWLHHQRESWIRIGQCWVPYPFQNNLHRLEQDQCQFCLEELHKAVVAPQSKRGYNNFADFIQGTFGKGIAELFMLPYNFKVWAYPPELMDISWIGDRVALPDVERVASNVAHQKDDVSWGPNNRFSFPRHGGTGAIWQALAHGLPSQKLQINCRVVSIEPKEKRLNLSDGRSVYYRSLISTMPLDQLTTICGEQTWQRMAEDLEHSSVHVIGIGLLAPAPPELVNKCWMYFPGAESPFYRVTHFSHYSPENVPDIGRVWSMMAEVSESAHKPVDASTVVDQTLQGLLSAGLIANPDQVIHTWHHRVEYGYPTPSLGRDVALQKLQTDLADEGILSRGRFGAWLYEVGNMDHSYMQGVEAVDRLLKGVPEITINDPNQVNNPK